MPRRIVVPIVLLIAAVLTAGSASAQTVPTPKEFFGFEIGADRKLARWDRIVEYLTIVAERSDRVRLDSLGRTTLDNPFVATVVSSPDNLERVDEYRQIARQLADGRGLSEAQARALADRGKAVVVITHNMHATEIGASQTSVELIYDLATADDADTREVLENVITVLVPSANPDGQTMVVDWYRQNVDTEFEGAPMPWLYHHYAGHDNNRDFFMGNLRETRHLFKLLYDDWNPQIYLDQHQMGRTGPRIFVPPYPDPQAEAIPALLWQQTKLVGGAIVTDLQAAGKPGVLNSEMYRIYGQEGALAVRHHNIVGLLTETASADIASPVTVTKQELLDGIRPGSGLDEYGFSVNFADPWWGGEWRLRDIVDYQRVAARAVLKTAARFRRDFLFNRYLMAIRNAARAETDGPFAFIVPRRQRDTHAAVDMLERLLAQGLEVHRATAPFQAMVGESDDERAVDYPAGTYVLRGDQPSRPALLDLMERRALEVKQLYPGGPYRRMHDAAGYTMPLQMGVEWTRVATPFDASLERVTTVRPESPADVAVASRAYVLNHEMNATFSAVNRLLREGIPVSRLRAPVSFDGRMLSAGAFVVSASVPDAHLALQAVSTELRVPVASDPPAVDGSSSRTDVVASRIALYKPWVASMDEGWTRYLLEAFGFSFANIDNDDVRQGSLGRRFDTLIIPAQIRLESLLDGHDADDVPAEYAGGIGAEGVEALKTFVLEGGT